mmetsp:Transcript_24901/g.28590  ORF Transcript_24901/g.28590 Transcript_24901/m.28590 type:complete len:99 (+) Transcript_24901:68-364(+)
MYDGRKVITPPPKIPNLILHQTFNEAALIDRSGNSNHAKGDTTRGSGYLISQGNSINFKGERYLEFPASSSLNTAFATDFSVSFWLYVTGFGTLSTEQ